MSTAERIRNDFLQQNAYSEDAFSPPERTLAIIKKILEFHDRASAMLKQGMPLEEALKKREEGEAGR
jgi:V/A-type H+-transporting ATPase subunit A